MIAAVIRWSARNVMLVLIGAALLVAAGIYAVRQVPLDAIPDLSDTQVIVYTEYAGQAPQVVEDQVTYPLSHRPARACRAPTVVRGFSFFGASFVYVIFEDGTDIYWARSRVLEYLTGVQRQLPSGVVPTLGPDATGVGWVYQYAVHRGETARWPSCARLQDWQVRFALAEAHGVAEVASVGGFVSGSTRSSSIRAGCRRFDIPLAQVRRGDPRTPTGRRRPRRRAGRDGVHGARPRLLPRASPTSSRSCSRRKAGAGAACATSPASSLLPTSAAASPSSTARARSSAASSCSATGPERALRHRRRQGEARRDRARAAGGRADRAGLRPLAS